MMQIAYNNYLPELGLEEDPTSFFDEYPMDSFVCPLDDFDLESFSGSPPESNSPNCFPAESPDQSAPARPTKRLKKFNTCATAAPQLISFQHFHASSHVENVCSESMDFEAFVSQGSYANQQLVGITTTRNPIQAQEHVLAERKRREKLSQKFIALSAILPGLKKMDKASVLGDAIKYVKQLQERVQTLEQHAVKITAGSSVLVKRSILFADEISDSHCDQMEVRVSGKDVLIRTQTDKHSGHAAIILGELEKLHFIVQSSSFLPFANNNIDITIISQMNKENCMTAKDILGRLRQALKQFL